MQKLKDVTALIETAGGLYLEATTSQQNVVEGDSVTITALINNRSGIRVSHQRRN